MLGLFISDEVCNDLVGKKKFMKVSPMGIAAVPEFALAAAAGMMLSTARMCYVA